MKKSKMLVDVPRDEVAVLADKYLEHYNVIENAKNALADIDQQLILSLRKAKRRSITININEYRSVTLEIQHVDAKEKIRVKK